jgi:hypothetical protein
MYPNCPLAKIKYNIYNILEWEWEVCSVVQLYSLILTRTNIVT